MTVISKVINDNKPFDNHERNLMRSWACECGSATSLCLIPTIIDHNFHMPKPCMHEF